MGKLLTVFRLTIAFVLGLLTGGLGTVGAIWMNEGVADLVIGGTERVRNLEHGMEAVEAQRDNLTKRLESLASVLEQVEQRYDGLGQRLQSIETGLLRQRDEAVRRPPPPPPASAPPANRSPTP